MRLGFGALRGATAAIWLVEGGSAARVDQLLKLGGAEIDCGDVSAFLSSGGLDALRRSPAASVAKRPNAVPVGEIDWKAPVSRSSKILCSAVNYPSHAAETNTEPPPEPYMFVKLTSALTGPYSPIVKPSFTAEMDYEAELALMIGKNTKNVSEKGALSCVAGYIALNDISFRDLQSQRNHPELRQRFGQNWLHGKGLDTACPAGPFLVSRDECGDGPFELNCYVNKERTQHSSTKEMIYDAASLISYASRGVTLWPGDVISTGTPAGTALSGTRGYLKVGDEVTTEVVNVGTLRNLVVDEPAGASR